MGVLILVFVLLAGFFGVTRLTDRLGWTALYEKRDASGSGLGMAMLGVEHLFADEHKRVAIVERRDEARQVRRQHAGDDPAGED